MNQTRLFAAMALAFTTLAGVAYADELTGTLKKVHDSGVIVLGTRESSIPFSYYDQNQNVVGYSQEIALKIVDALKQKTNMPNLKVKTVPITSQNRIPLVQNGTIDIECGSTTNTFERQNQAAFSNSIFLYGIRFITRKDSGVKDFPDLAGKTVVTTAGTSDERLLRKMNEEKRMNMTIISAKDHAESFLNVTTGRAVAFVMDEPLLYGERAKTKKPNDYVVTGTPPISENYACMFRRDDPQFKALVDDTVAKMETSGEMARLYTKWFTQPIPPNGMNLDYPLSQQMKDLFAHPNDKALD
ncbi:glutamate/aspartate ABC transporter substrate-binding protein [Paraburkholderia tagetis]|uniref:Glutamate/aspartate ABC transporter substrate-binding protein n=1 Tax=Paraburkholderia tagetis TaxID=2913261 RepID=A0A9X1ZX39_9BURK|nr:glutamate/aspartate ABC transporter substrate-binding protein [Paraburkholderia tagetis]MCG5077537.1 glutamate/aspartate ABC transporter substrate-binding protein [Paraburkholderia tagetis]